MEKLKELIVLGMARISCLFRINSLIIFKSIIMCINIWCIQIFVVNNMTDSDDSDCGVGIVRLKSVQSEWEMAPETTEFKLKVRSESGEIKNIFTL